MPVGVRAAQTPEDGGKSDAQTRREAAKAQLEAESAAEGAEGGHLAGEHEGDDETGSLSGATVMNSEDIISSGRASGETAHEEGVGRSGEEEEEG